MDNLMTSFARYSDISMSIPIDDETEWDTMNNELSPEDEVRIESKANLADASKDIDNFGNPYNILKDFDDFSRCSEWAVAYAMQPYNVGDTVLAIKLQDALETATLQQYLDHMIELGYMEAVFTEEDEMAYRITKTGVKYAKHRLGL